MARQPSSSRPISDPDTRAALRAGTGEGGREPGDQEGRGPAGRSRTAGSGRDEPASRGRQAARSHDEVVVGPVEGTFRVAKADVSADERGRVVLGNNLVGERHYRVLVNDLGQIVLDPTVTIPARELWLYRNPAALTSVLRGAQQAEAGDLEEFVFDDGEEEGAGGQKSEGRAVPVTPSRR